MTTVSQDRLLELLERDHRPEGTFLSAQMTPKDYALMRELAAKWDTHPINALGRAVHLASELQAASSQGAEITVRWRRLRRRRSQTIAAAWKGPRNK